MQNTILLIFVFVSLSILSCNKDNDVQPTEETNPDTELVLSSSDQQAIFAARTANNEAIKALNAPNVAAIYTDNFFILTSTNGFFEGKENVEGIYKSVFESREDVLFVRTPTAITVNTDWSMASENGTWIGTWKVDGENIEVSGDYYAKWHKIEGIWKLRCEVYTQFDCSGEVVCSNKPTL